MVLKELLQLRGLDLSVPIKVVRHISRSIDLEELYRLGQLEVYQSYQAKETTFNCDYIVSLIATEGSRARFVGLYRVKGSKPEKETTLPSDFIHPEMSYQNDTFFDLEKLPGYEDLENRLIVEWGRGTKSWIQWRLDKEVLEILPTGYVKDFPGYLEFILSHDELRDIVENPVSNRVWHKMLSGVAGVYLIVDTKTGRQYVGSAYGKSGILGRWTSYAKTGHGGNEELTALLKTEKDYARRFQFTILAITSTTSSRNEVLRLEGLYKKKLGSRAYGLNLN